MSLAPRALAAIALILGVILTTSASAFAQGIGSSCEEDEECSIGNSACLEGTCECIEGYVNFQDACLKAAEDYGDDCEDDVQCRALTPDQELIFCSKDTNTCLCPEKMHFRESMCWNSLYLTEKCENSNECVVEYSICAESVCACSEAYEARGKERCIARPRCDLVQNATGEYEDCKCDNPDYIIDASFTKCIPASWGGAGDACAEARQCGQRMGQGALCTDGECGCADGFHYLHGRCWQTRGFGEACEADAQCVAFAESDAYVCEEGKCACAEFAETKRPGDSPLCRRRTAEGEECESDIDCVDGLSCASPTTDALDTVCRNLSSSTTSDISPRILNHDSATLLLGGRFARRARGLNPRPTEPEAEDGDGDEDDDDDDEDDDEDEDEDVLCGSNEEHTPSGKACVCRLGYFRSSASGPCLPELGEPCRVGEVDEADVHIEYATCRRSARVNFSSPAAPAALNEPSGVWACLGGFVPSPSNRACEKTRRHTNNCQHDVQCGYYGGYCKDGKSCQCEDKHHYDSESLVCWPTRGLNETCESNSDCGVATANSIECVLTEDSTQELCSCKSGYHEVDSDCRKEAYSIGEKCTVDSDCVFGLEDPLIFCDAGYCDCTDGYFEKNETSCQVGVGGPCSQTTDCGAVAFTQCEEGECRCIGGYVRSSRDSCVPVAAEYGAECEVEEQCSGLTEDGELITCSWQTQTCVCPDNYHYLNRQCWNTHRINEKCNRESECIVKNSICKNSFCACDIGYRAEGTDKCVDNAASFSQIGSFITLATLALGSRLL